MSIIDVDIFINSLMKDSAMQRSVKKDFMKYENGKFEVFVFDNKTLVLDKRDSKKTIVYNGYNIAKANLNQIKTNSH